VTNPEAHGRSDGFPAFEIRPPKGFRPDDVAGHADRNRKSGRVLFDETLTNELLGLLHGAAPSRQRIRRHHRCDGLRIGVEGIDIEDEGHERHHRGDRESNRPAISVNQVSVGLCFTLAHAI
jgi:hypothetical protein